MLAQISYGLPFWHPSPTCIRKLTSLYLKPLRRALHLPYSTHILGLQMDADILDINKRQTQLAHNYLQKTIKQAEHHPAKCVINTIVPKHKHKTRYGITTIHQRYQ
jgi:hypothetical protein